MRRPTGTTEGGPKSAAQESDKAQTANDTMPEAAIAAHQRKMRRHIERAMREVQQKYGTPTLVNNQGEIARTSTTEITIASKLWIIRWNPSEQRFQILTFHRADSTDAKPQPDTFGGKESRSRDEGRRTETTIREVLEESVMPLQWAAPLGTLLGEHENGQCIAHIRNPYNHHLHQIHNWLLITPAGHGAPDVTLTKGKDGGEKEAKPGSLQWRGVDEVATTLDQFRTFKIMAQVIRSLTVFSNGAALEAAKTIHARATVVSVEQIFVCCKGNIFKLYLIFYEKIFI